MILEDDVGMRSDARAGVEWGDGGASDVGSP
jgi:hypothetical protein